MLCEGSGRVTRIRSQHAEADIADMKKRLAADLAKVADKIDGLVASVAKSFSSYRPDIFPPPCLV